jgi:predicted DsbA family dithiol-disulfide isomerase
MFRSTNGSDEIVSHSFAITYDYLCPFARIANEAVIEAIEDGVDWDVTFHPFSLSQVHIDEGSSSVWDRPLGAEGTRGTRAHAWALAVTELAPDRFLAFHKELFAARHDRADDVDDEGVLRAVASTSGVDGDAVAAAVASGGPLARLGESHTEAVRQWSVFGVPTFIKNGTAVFVRLMERHRVDDVERVLDLLDWSRLNEYKHTTIPR